MGLRRDFGYWSGGGLLAFAAIGAVAWVALAFGQIARTVDGYRSPAAQTCGSRRAST
jgi:hypothetical protein